MNKIISFLQKKKSKKKRFKYEKKNFLDGSIKLGKYFFFGMLFLGMIYFFFGSSLFLLREIKIDGYSKFLNKEQITKLAKIPLDENIFRADLSSLISNLKRFPWIQDVSIRRQLPHQIIIKVTEYTPIALLEVYDSNTRETLYYLVSDKGKIFTSVSNSEKWKLPLLRGFTKYQFDEFPLFAQNHFQKSFQSLQEFLKLNQGTQLKIESLTYDFVQGLTISLNPPVDYKENYPMKIYLGKKSFSEIDSSWNIFLKKLISQQLWYREVDFHVPGKIFARI